MQKILKRKHHSTTQMVIIQAYTQRTRRRNYCFLLWKASKLQHRGTFDATKCSAGFQIWYGKTSKWFSYGPAKGAQFKTQYDAYQAVLDWVWGKHAEVVGHEAASESRAKNIGKYGKANAPYWMVSWFASQLSLCGATMYIKNIDGTNNMLRREIWFGSCIH